MTSLVDVSVSGDGHTSEPPALLPTAEEVLRSGLALREYGLLTRDLGITPEKIAELLDLSIPTRNAEIVRLGLTGHRDLAGKAVQLLRSTEFRRA